MCVYVCEGGRGGAQGSVAAISEYLIAISTICRGEYCMIYCFTHVFYAAGVSNLLTTSGSVAGGTRCTLQGEGVKNDAYFKCLAPTRILLISQLNTD